MKFIDSTRKFIKELPHDFRALRASLTDPESAAGYKYIFRPEIEDFFAFMAGMVGTLAMILPGGQGFGLAAYGAEAFVLLQCFGVIGERHVSFEVDDTPLFFIFPLREFGGHWLNEVIWRLDNIQD